MKYLKYTKFKTNFMKFVSLQYFYGVEQIEPIKITSSLTFAFYAHVYS